MAEEGTGAEILVRSLQDLDVTQIFRYAGATILPVFHELAKAGMAITVNSNERCSAFGAAGYSRASDRVGVAVKFAEEIPACRASHLRSSSLPVPGY